MSNLKLAVQEISDDTARGKLVEIFKADTSTHPLIAVDLDDVLCQTTNCVVECASVLIIQIMVT
jgi:hypothetical protein